MELSEIVRALNSLSFETISNAINSKSYPVVERASCCAILYATRYAEKSELESINTNDDVISFLINHKN